MSKFCLIVEHEKHHYYVEFANIKFNKGYHATYWEPEEPWDFEYEILYVEDECENDVTKTVNIPDDIIQEALYNERMSNIADDFD